MTQSLRILVTGLRPARWNVAMTAALADMHTRDLIPDTVRFHRYPACVLVGRTQEINRALDVEYCRQGGIEIARRVTGGGAVFMSPRMLAWDVVLDRRPSSVRLGSVRRRICEGVAIGLAKVGAPARFCPPNDIAINGRKVSGSSGYTVARSAVLQGTVLIEDDIAMMARALRIPGATLRAKVTCLVNELREIPPLESVAARIAAGLVEVLQKEPTIKSPGPDETALCDTVLRTEIGTDEFVFGSAAAQAAVSLHNS